MSERKAMGLQSCPLHEQFLGSGLGDRLSVFVAAGALKLRTDLLHNPDNNGRN